MQLENVVPGYDHAQMLHSFSKPPGEIPSLFLTTFSSTDSLLNFTSHGNVEKHM